MRRKFLERSNALVTVRPMVASDYEQWKQSYLCAKPAKNKWDVIKRSEADLTRAKFQKSLRELAKRRKKGDFYDFGIFAKSGELVGFIAIMEVARGISHTAYLGYRLFNHHWGQGYAKKACQLTFDIAFRDLKLHRLEAGIEPQNRRSLALAKSLKMRREGLKKRSLYLRKTWVDLVMYSLTTEDLGIRFSTQGLNRRSLHG